MTLPLRGVRARALLLASLLAACAAPATDAPTEGDDAFVAEDDALVDGPSCADNTVCLSGQVHALCYAASRDGSAFETYQDLSIPRDGLYDFVRVTARRLFSRTTGDLRLELREYPAGGPYVPESATLVATSTIPGALLPDTSSSVTFRFSPAVTLHPETDSNPRYVAVFRVASNKLTVGLGCTTLTNQLLGDTGLRRLVNLSTTPVARPWKKSTREVAIAYGYAGTALSPCSGVTGATCDDGNQASGDGCSASCQVESGWHCSGLPSTCVNSEVNSCRAIQLANPSAANGAYTIDPNGGSPADAIVVNCNMSDAGGGWTQLVPGVQAALDDTTPKQYLYMAGNAEYRSPVTTHKWSWSSGVEVPGTYHWSNGAAAQVSCSGSSEKPAIGIGCSDGPGNQRKVLPVGVIDANAATANICQDTPGIFGPTCAPATIWVREVRGCGLTQNDAANNCEAIRSSAACTTKTDGVYWLRIDATPIQAWCDMTTDGGGWTLVHKTNRANANDRDDSGYNQGALTNPAIDAVAIHSRNIIDLIGSEVRIVDASGTRKFFYKGAPYYVTDVHPNQYYAPQAKLAYSDPYTAPNTGSVIYAGGHSICISLGNDFGATAHVCPNRFCCESDNAGLWLNGGPFLPGAYYAGSAWIR